jgi:hypothetical protein
VEIAAEVAGPAVAAEEVVAADAGRVVVDGVVMVGLDTRNIRHGFSPIHAAQERKAATKVVAFLSAFEFKSFISCY